MKTHTQWWSWAVIVAGLAFMLQAPLGVKAQEAQVGPDVQSSQDAPDAQGPEDQDPPGRVARLNLAEGWVSFQPGGENDWVDAVLNRPLVTGDNLWADENSRAEVHIGSTALRLGSKTGITLLELGDRAAQIRLAQGSLIIKVRHVDDEDSYEIDTPNVAFTVSQPGDYRIDVDPDGNRTEVTVWRGRGEVTGGGTWWRPGGLVGGWAPYRFGHWIWVAPWGWTWVEDEPWGFAPFHYGRWAFAGAGWFWVPGPVYVRPVWAPALVGWVGGGAGFRFSVGVGVGWFPLGPGEVFIPGYRVSRRYVNNVNITNTRVNITNVTNVYNTVVINRTVNNIRYANRNVNGGVTVVSHDTFVNARPVARNVVSVPARELASAPVSHTVAVEPARTSVLGAGRPAVRRPPMAGTNPPAVALRKPATLPRPTMTQPPH